MNTWDTAIVLTTAGNVFAFSTIHIVLFRRIKAERVFSWLVYTFVIASLATAGATVLWYGTGFYPVELSDVRQVGIIIVCALVLSGLFCILYVLACFGIIESSIHIRILEEIAKTGDRGITKAQLRQRYNTRIIVAKRLERLQASGEIVKKGESYTKEKKVSVFRILAWIFQVFWYIYRGNLQQ